MAPNAIGDNVIGAVQAGDVLVYGSTATYPGWYWVERGALKGWMNTLSGAVRIETIATVPPATEPGLTQDELNIIAGHFAEIAEVFREAASRREI